MHWLIVWYFRFFERSWRRPVALGRWRALESAEWNRRVGQFGEDVAAARLRAMGRKVLFRRYRPKGGGEVDIVARDGEVLVFCEVKTRTSRDFGRPASAVDAEKRRLLTRGANAWIRELGFTPLLFRFDIIEVILIEGERPDIEVIENAFPSATYLLA